MPCGWEANYRSDVALAMSHRLQWFIHLQAHGIRHEYLSLHSSWIWHSLLFVLLRELLLSIVIIQSSFFALAVPSVL